MANLVAEAVARKSGRMVIMDTQLIAKYCLLLCLFIATGCNHAESSSAGTAQLGANLTVEDLVTAFAHVTYETEADVAAAIANASAAERAVVFVHVDWAFLDEQQSRFAEFLTEFQQRYPSDPLKFYYVDCTPVTNGYTPLRSLRGWQELHEAAGSHLIHGQGELIWLERGRVLCVQPILQFDSAAALVDKTVDLMAGQHGE